MLDFHLNKVKVTDSLLYICQKTGGSLDMYTLLKILYFAEGKHLVYYGRPITGDAMVAMDYGPVPSSAYDQVKLNGADLSNFSRQDEIITGKTPPNLDNLSESDIECLDESIQENKDLGFSRLKNKSHDAAYNWTVSNFGKNTTIPFIEIAKAYGADEAMIEYIKTNAENLNCLLDVGRK